MAICRRFFFIFGVFLTLTEVSWCFLANLGTMTNFSLSLTLPLPFLGYRFTKKSFFMYWRYWWGWLLWLLVVVTRPFLPFFFHFIQCIQQSSGYLGSWFLWRFFLLQFSTLVWWLPLLGWLVDWLVLSIIGIWLSCCMVAISGQHQHYFFYLAPDGFASGLTLCLPLVLADGLRAWLLMYSIWFSFHPLPWFVGPPGWPWGSRTNVWFPLLALAPFFPLSLLVDCWVLALFQFWRCHFCFLAFSTRMPAFGKYILVQFSSWDGNPFQPLLLVDQHFVFHHLLLRNRLIVVLVFFVVWLVATSGWHEPFHKCLSCICPDLLLQVPRVFWSPCLLLELPCFWDNASCSLGQRVLLILGSLEVWFTQFSGESSTSPINLVEWPVSHPFHLSCLCLSLPFWLP